MVKPLVGVDILLLEKIRTRGCLAGSLFKLYRRLPYGCDLESNSPSALALVTGALQVKFSQT